MTIKPLFCNVLEQPKYKCFFSIHPSFTDEIRCAVTVPVIPLEILKSPDSPVQHVSQAALKIKLGVRQKKIPLKSYFSRIVSWLIVPPIIPLDLSAPVFPNPVSRDLCSSEPVLGICYGGSGLPFA